MIRLWAMLSDIPVYSALAAILLASMAALALGAPQGRHPFPPAVERANPMQAPGLLGGPRLPLLPAKPRTGYEAFLQQPVEGAQRPLFLGLLALYRTVISPLNGSNSDLAPVHSLYAVQAIKEHGVLLGSVLTTERLFHEPDEIPYAPSFLEEGRVFHYDPLAWNVYWLPDWMR